MNKFEQTMVKSYDDFQNGIKALTFLEYLFMQNWRFGERKQTFNWWTNSVEWWGCV